MEEVKQSNLHYIIAHTAVEMSSPASQASPLVAAGAKSLLLSRFFVIGLFF